MQHTYHVRVTGFSTIGEIDGARPVGDLAALLDVMEYGDRSGLSDADLREICLMSLQDQGPAEAAYIVLKHDLGDSLRDGQLRNMANEMLEEKLWEDYVDPAFHERLFNVASLLFSAMPQVFPQPDAVRVTLNVTAADAASGELLTASPDESFLVRLLADGMDGHAVLHRLYGDQITGRSFPNAANIVWIVRARPSADRELGIEVIGSGYWLDGLQDTKAYESHAYADDPGAT